LKALNPQKAKTPGFSALAFLLSVFNILVLLVI
jgi:hypothetical protein